MTVPKLSDLGLSGPVEDMAVALSAAVRIEPQLIRAVRLTVFPYHDVSVETDLWFSAAVSSRGAQGLAFDGAARLLLQEALAARLAGAARTDPVHRIGDVIARVHAHLSPALRVEEQVTWLALSGAEPAIDDALRPVLKAVVYEGRAGIARWFATAVHRMPEAVRLSVTAWKLAQVVQAQLSDGPSPVQLVRSGVGAGDLADVVDALGDVSVLARRAGAQLEVGDLPDSDRAVGISVPDTDPVLLEVVGTRSTAAQSLVIPRGSFVRLQVGTGPVRLQTARGTVFDLPSEEPPDPHVRIQFVGVAATAYDDPGLPSLPDVMPELELLDSLLGQGEGLILRSPTRAELLGQLDRLRPNAEALVLVWRGHALPSPDGPRLLLRDGVGDRAVAGVPVTEIGRICTRSGAAQILFVLDTCTAGMVVDVSSAFVGRMAEPSSQDSLPVWLGQLESRQPVGDESDGRLTRSVCKLLTDGPRSPELARRWSPHNRLIRGDDLANAVLQQWEGSGPFPRFTSTGSPWWMLPNPLYRPHVSTEAVGDLLRAARGSAGPQEGSWFTGRASEVDTVVGWMRSGRPGLHVITGAPGSGKSAIVGRVVSLADHAERRRIMESGEYWRHADPGESSVAAQVHAFGRTAGEVVAAIAEQLVNRRVLDRQEMPSNALELAAQVSRAVQRGGELPVVVVDGLDEACDEVFAIAAALQLLALTAIVVVATRDVPGGEGQRSLLDVLAPGGPGIDLNQPDVRERTVADLRAYVVARLTGIDPRMDPNAVADRFVEEDTASFLTIRLITDQLRSIPVDTSEPGWHRSFNVSFIDAFEEDLAAAAEPVLARRVLTALSWSIGSGFPKDEWLACANALSAVETVTPASLERVLEELGRYVVQSDELDHTVFRLFHAALVHHLNPPTAPATEPFEPLAVRVAAALVDRYASLLGAGVPADAPAYLRRHLWRHAAQAGPAGLKLFRTITEIEPRLRLDLARAATYVAEQLGTSDDPAAALAPAEEAADRYLDLVTDSPNLAPDLVRALDTVCSVRRRSGDEAGAERVWQDALDTLPPVAAGSVLLARARADLAHPEAVGWLITALGLAEDDPALVNAVRDTTRRLRQAAQPSFDAEWRRHTGETVLPSWLATDAGRPTGTSPGGSWPSSTDLVVVLPGFGGSTLYRAGKPVWSTSAGALLRVAAGVGRSLLDLQLPDGIGDEHPDDGVEPVDLIRDVRVLPGVWTAVSGYDRLLARLRSLGYRDTSAAPDALPGNLLPLAYDWRLSYRWTGRWLGSVVEPALDRWRRHSPDHADARVVFVCFSTGGLAARWYVERCGGLAVTSRLVTIGTPYQGIPRSLAQLVNGMRTGVGALGLDLTDFARRLPSLYQTLPVYPCVELGDDVRRLTEVDVPRLDARRVADGAEFLNDLLVAERTRPAGLLATTAIAGTGQPTPAAVRFEADRVVTLPTLRGENFSGDSVVPLFSASHPESSMLPWTVRERHGNLQRNTDVLDQLEELLIRRRVMRR